MDEDPQRKTINEEIEIAGAQLVDKIKSIIAEGNVRQVRIKDADGDVFLETPLTFGAIAGGAVVLAAPWLAMLGVLAALVTRVRIEVVRESEVSDGTAVPPQSSASPPSEDDSEKDAA